MYRKLFLCLLCSATTLCLGQTRMISHVTRSDGGFTTDLILENIGVGQNTVTLIGYNPEGVEVARATPTLDGVSTTTMAASAWFDGTDVSHLVIEGSDIRATAAYRSSAVGASPAHVGESTKTARRYRFFAGNWQTVFDGLAIVNAGSAAADVRISQKTADGEEQKVVLAAGGLAPMGKALFVVGGAGTTHFEAVEGAYYEVYSDQPLALTPIRGNFPGSDLLWVNQAEEQTLAIVKVTNDAPEKTDCSDHLSLGDDASDINNMPQAEVMMDVSEDGRLAAGAKDYRYGPTNDNTYNVRVWSGLYTSADKGGSWTNRNFDDASPDGGMMSDGRGDFGQPLGETLLFRQQSDPVLAFDRDGNLYTNALLFDSQFDPNISPLAEPSAQVVTRMDKDGNVVPGTTHFVGAENDPTLFNDKNWIAVDRSSPVEETVVVLTWRLFVTPDATVPGGGYLAVSADGNTTFSKPIKMPIPDPENQSAQFYQPIIGKDAVTGKKTLYIVTRTVSPQTFSLNLHLLKVALDSTPPGDTAALETWLTNANNWTYVNMPVGGMIAYGASAFGGNFRFSSYFSPAIDRETGELFLAAQSFEPNTQGSQTVILKSSDGGLTWTAPKVLDYQNPSHQIFPTITCHSGTVSVIWYDTRHDENFTPFASFAKMDVYYAELDNQLNVLRVDRLTKKSMVANVPTFVRDNGQPAKGKKTIQPHDFDWSGFIGAGLGSIVPAKPKASKVCAAYGFLGDYIGITADKDYAYLTWCDTRDQKIVPDDYCTTSACDGRRNSNIYFARIRKTQSNQ